MERSRSKISQRTYPRSARVNALLQEVLAESLTQLSDHDERIGLTTITGVSCDPDLRHAVVFLSSTNDEVEEALEEHRRAMQATIAKQVRMKRVPQLKFMVDPAIVAGIRIDEALKRARESDSPEPTN
jgi:ribosome-binding factor A